MTLLINAYCTLNDVPPLDFPHQLLARRSPADPELPPHLDGFVGYVLGRGKQEMTRVKYHLMRHIQRVRHQVSLRVAQDELDGFAAWAWAANAIVFLEDGSLRDPSGRILLDAAGSDPDPAARIPHPADAEARKDRSAARLEALGVRAMAGLPPVIAEGEVILRPMDEVAQRALALMIVAVRGECWNSGEAFPDRILEQQLPLGFAALSPKEAAFLAAAEPTQQETVNFTWRYEALLLLQWALGWLPDLPEPTAICDVPAAVARIREAGQAGFLARSALRSPAEILDALDLHYRLHWAVRQARLDKKPPLDGIEPGVVAERHYALNWLVRFEEAEWDAVDTPT